MRDYEALASALVRAIRGKRSQAQLSRRLGYRSNVVFDWESARRFPTAATFFRAAQKTGIDTRRGVERFLRRPDGRARTIQPTSREGIVRLLEELRGRATIGSLARATGASRFSVSRWLAGHSEPRLPDFLNLVEHTSLRLLDFVAAFTDPAVIPAVAAEWRALTLGRELAYDKPWSHAVLRALELADYRNLDAHAPGFLAERLGISIEQEREGLLLLEQAHQVRRAGGRYVIDEGRTVDTRQDPTRSRALRAFWTRVAADRLASGSDGEFAFNLFGVSSADLARLRDLQRAYFQELRDIVARSEPVEHVVLMNLQLVPLTTNPAFDPRPVEQRRTPPKR